MAYFADNPNCPSSFLSGIGFQFNLEKLPGVSFYCQSANVPSQNLAVATQPTRFNALPEPGDEINYDDLTIRFLVDEDLKNYLVVHNWIKEYGLAEKRADSADAYSNARLQIMTSHNNVNHVVEFKNMFPVSLSSVPFDATVGDIEYLLADVTFKFETYTIRDENFKALS